MKEQIDEKILKEKGITQETVNEQLQNFAAGFPYLEIKRAAAPGDGIMLLLDEEVRFFLQQWENYLKTPASVLKFVPASGAASRMFKDLYEFLERESEISLTAFELKFFDNIHRFAFFDELNAVCLKTQGKDIDTLLSENQHKRIVALLLKDTGLSYGSLPKGLLRFHHYPEENRTPMQEHLVEGALYAAGQSKKVNIHFTVSKEHRTLFEKHLAESVPVFENRFGVKYHVGFSEQKPSTDTIAVDADNQPFIENGLPLFRPGGHGALIQNLNEQDADIIFIKNIDNVVPDGLKETTITYKKVLAGLLTTLQKKAFGYLRKMEDGIADEQLLAEVSKFCEKELSIENPGLKTLKGEALRDYLFTKLNRPMRVCGMVKNAGEPGGGPFLTVNQDGTISPQILESSQINLSDPQEKQKMLQATHFNPVDLVCAVRDYRGEKFDLLKYVDKNTGFISSKSKSGRELKALELPGLWNGAMSDWNTVFVEVPIETFNPVKTVNDLLRPQHQ